MIKMELRVGSGIPVEITASLVAEAVEILRELDTKSTIKVISSAPAQKGKLSQIRARAGSTPQWTMEECAVVHDAVVAAGDPKKHRSAEIALGKAMEGLRSIGSNRSRGTTRGIVTGFRKAIFYKARGTHLPRGVRMYLASKDRVTPTITTNVRSTNYLDGIVPPRVINVSGPIEA